MRVITLTVLTWGAHQAAFRGKLDRQANGPLHLAAQSAAVEAWITALRAGSCHVMMPIDE